MGGFYLLCVINNVKALETLDKQLSTILRLESKNQINKLIYSTEVFLGHYDEQAKGQMQPHHRG